MKKLYVSIEIDGVEHKVGEICGDSFLDAEFSYTDEYVEKIGKAISIGLPVLERHFDAIRTRNFFEGLLPEGFSRRAIAGWIGVEEEDYLTLLARLGQECIGAIRIYDDSMKSCQGEYEKLDVCQIHDLAKEGATKSTELLMESRLSLAGASGKVGLYLDEDSLIWYQPKGNAPSTHIVKQSHVRFDKLVQNELLCLNTARKMGIEVSDCTMMKLEENRGENDNIEDVLFVTKRYDREEMSNRQISGLAVPFRLHQEDFGQALGISSLNKYEKNGGYMKRMFECLRRYSANPIADQLALWDRIIFNSLIGNADGHVKNYGLLYDKSLSGIRLAPAYDIVSTKIYPLTRDMSFAIGGKYKLSEIDRETFRQAANEVGLGEKLAMSRYDKLSSVFVDSLKDAAEELEGQGISGCLEIRDKILKA